MSNDSRFANSDSDERMDELSFVFDNGCSFDNFIREECPMKEYFNSAKSNWPELPPLVLEKIFMCLNREDQRRMSEVCKNWFQEYRSIPSLWRNVTFVTPERERSTDICLEARYARKYGHLFHHVEIICQKILWGHNGLQLKSFLKALTVHNQLLSLSFIDMGRYFNVLDKRVYEDIFKVILILLSSQNNLKTIEFRNAWFTTVEAEEVFRVISKKQIATTKILKLEGFVAEPLVNHFNAVLVHDPLLYGILMYLREICIDYSQLFETMIKTCFKYATSEYPRCRKGPLERMKLTCDYSKSVSYDGIKPLVWKILSEMWPELKIYFSLHPGHALPQHSFTQHQNTIAKFIVPYMPIKSFNFKGSEPNTQIHIENEIESVFVHLVKCKVNEYLEVLKIEMTQSRSNLVENLIGFVQDCPRLREIYLDIKLPVDALIAAFDFWLENRPITLELVHVTVANGITIADFTNYSNLEIRYVPLFEQRGLSLNFTIDQDLLVLY